MPGVKKSAPNYWGGQSLQPLRPEKSGRIAAIESIAIGKAILPSARILARRALKGLRWASKEVYRCPVREARNLDLAVRR